MIETLPNINIKETLDNLTETQKDIVTKLCKNYPLSAISFGNKGITIKCLCDKQVIDSDGGLYPKVKKEWCKRHKITESDHVHPDMARLDCLDNKYIRVLVELMRFNEESTAYDRSQAEYRIIKKLCSRGILNNVSHGEYDLTPEIAAVWEDWCTQNKERINNLFVEIGEHQQGQPISTSLMDLSDDNTRNFWQLHKGEQQFLEKTLRPCGGPPYSVAEFNALASGYIDNCLRNRKK